MKKLIYIVFIFLLLIACNNEKVNIDKSTIKELSNGDFKIPSRYGYLLLFIKSKNSIGCTNINVLHGIYVHYYLTSYDSFEAFLSDALNQKIRFEYDKLKSNNIKLFRLNADIQIAFEKHNISYVLMSYCLKREKNKFIVKKQYQYTEYLYTILYYFFTKNYKVSQDDYVGEYIISK